jgi:DNA replication and repair protein RecF
MFLKSLKIKNFRNFEERQFLFSDGFIALEGKNGIGKSNLLESIYLLCTGKSYRNTKKKEMINFNSDFFYVEGNFNFDSANKTVSTAISYNREKNTVFIQDMVKKESYIDWFIPPRPVISFSNNDINLIYGPPENRRKFLDLFGCLLDPSYLQILLEYRYWLNCKNVLLNGNFDVCLCDIYDEKIATTGSEIIKKRILLIENLKLNFMTIYQNLANNSETVEIVYNLLPEPDKFSINDCKNVFYTMLRNCRKKDQQLGYSSYGPHRDDVSFLLNERAARQFSSQGQGRTLALAIKLSSSMTLEKTLNERLVYIIDDTVSELDKIRTDNFFPYVKNRGQVFMALPEGKLPRNNDFNYINISSEE